MSCGGNVLIRLDIMGWAFLKLNSRQEIAHVDFKELYSLVKLQVVETSLVIDKDLADLDAYSQGMRGGLQLFQC